MIAVSVAEAQQRLPELLSAVASGEGVVIQEDTGRTFHLTATRTRPSITGAPRAGRWQGLFVVPDDFDEPLEELSEYME